MPEKSIDLAVRDAPSTTSSRLVWIDSSRALAVTAVVLFHVTMWHYEPFVDSRPELIVEESAAERWLDINGLVNGLRMPLLLSVSGLLMSRKIRGGDRRGTVRGALTNGWLYVVWSVVYLFASSLLSVTTPHRIDGIADWSRQLLLPETPLWYLLALVTYAVGLYALRRVPTVLLLGGLAILSVYLDHMPADGVSLWRKIGLLAFYFAIGVRFSALLHAAAARSSAARSAGVALLVVVLIYLDRFVERPYLYESFSLLRNIVALFGAITIVAWLVRWRPFGQVAAAVGQRTLEIYVVHVLIVQAIDSITEVHATWLTNALGHPSLARTYPVVLTVLIVVVCLGIGAALRSLRVMWLFRLPRSIAQAVTVDRPPPPAGAHPWAARLPLDNGADKKHPQR